MVIVRKGVTKSLVEYTPSEIKSQALLARDACPIVIYHVAKSGILDASAITRHVVVPLALDAVLATVIQTMRKGLYADSVTKLISISADQTLKPLIDFRTVLRQGYTYFSVDSVTCQAFDTVARFSLVNQALRVGIDADSIEKAGIF